MIRKLFLIANVTLLVGHSLGQNMWAQTSDIVAEIDIELASTYFRELDAIAQEDGGKLWGVSLAGPALFVVPSSRSFASNMQVITNSVKLEQRGNVFVGTLPQQIPIANTSIRWAERNWTMMMWPLLVDLTERRVLMAHEAWHRIQDKIQIAAGNESNSHLDSMIARICLQMEWLALSKALASNNDQRQQAVVNALVFRTIRRQRFPNAADEENRMERKGIGLC